MAALFIVREVTHSSITGGTRYASCWTRALTSALGTDSLASNRTLSLLDELRFLYKERKDLKPQEILLSATLNGAKALGFGNRLGILKSGYVADLTVLEIPQDMEIFKAPEQILEGAGECIGTVVGGRIAWRKTDPSQGSVDSLAPGRHI